MQAACMQNTTAFRLVHPSNQTTCFYRIFLATFAQAFRDPVNSPTSSLMAGPTGLFNFTSLHAPFTKRIIVTIPYITLSNNPFTLSLLRSSLFGRNLFHGLSRELYQ
ncbi:hypothetical protein HZ326_15070 [Fusarium oxysporum f. sp. albedinis]|nr:hypothetical protein HZ326_15070 [Fusarium oxysporum f. sp. albedinis]